jgi:hypothetical protein
VKFGESVITESRGLLREALLRVGDHDALPDSPQHIVHHQQNLLTILSGREHEHFANSAGIDFASLNAWSHFDHIHEGFGRVQEDLGFERVVWFAYVILMIPLLKAEVKRLEGFMDAHFIDSHEILYLFLTKSRYCWQPVETHSGPLAKQPN